MRRVAVVFGGKSCENEISVLTGVFVLNVLDRTKYEVLPVYLHTDGAFYTAGKMFDLGTFRKGNYGAFQRIFFEGGTAYLFRGAGKKIKEIGRIDVALNCCHGGLGEGGGVSALMQMNGIPLASPELTASGVFMDKGLTKLAAKALSVPTVEFVRFEESEYRRRGAFVLKNIESRLGYPAIVKPARLGSSIGLTVAENEEEIKEAIEAAFELDERVVVEKFLKGKKDINCAAYSLGGEIFVSEPEEAASGEGIYSFSDKYLKGGAAGGKNAEKMQSARGRGSITGELREKIRMYTKTLYKRMSMYGIVRMDYLLSGDKVYLGEVNTVPGSLAYYLFCDRISDARGLFGALLEDAIARAKGGEKRIIRTGILEG
ncbi:MAG: ATP-grasp domain-containing protein [Clostridia bacterium]|nr:ATP-grasp domain-containing protein [Clostridia bacterium]